IDAVSREKLYVRFDRKKSYLMFGDILTDFRETTLSAFTRTLTGAKTEIKTEKVELKAFASRTDQTQVVEALPGKGISGYYYLRFQPVVEGSEIVVIETRDRRQMDKVLKREGKLRNTDYFVDYDRGAILFKEAIPSYDQDFNPIFIIVSYETSGGKTHYIYGGRVVLRVLPWFDLGATAVTEENEISDYFLSGADLTLRLPGKTTIQTELARTRSLFEESGVVTPKKDWGWLVKLESHPVDKLKIVGQYRDIGRWFGNLSAVDALRGFQQSNLDVSYHLNDLTTVKARWLREEDRLNDNEHTYGGATIEKKTAKTSYLAELYHETAEGSYIFPPSSESRYPFDIRENIPERSTAIRLRVKHRLNDAFSFLAEHRHNFLSDQDRSSQVGLDYRLEKNRKLYLRQEFGQYAGRTETRTALGIEAEVSQTTVAFNEYRLRDGLEGNRSQQVIGLRNRFLLGNSITGDLRIENLSTVSGPQRQEQPDALAISTGVEYLPQEQVKITGRLEYRHQEAENTYLAEFGTAYRFNPDFCLLFRQRFFFDDMTSGQRITGRTLLGMAYRPVEHDRFQGLVRMEFKNDRDTTTDAGNNGNTYIISTEGHYQMTARTQLSGKYAGKLCQEHGFSHYTDLVSGRILQDLTSRLDFGPECRTLRSRLTRNFSLGGSAEVGWRLLKNLWVSLGYSFDDFDSDLVGDNFQGKGPYFKIRFKCDETLLKSLLLH
ncbi:MAG: hypothetical protein NC823_02000, partial [Candidatus Omnitrophica bacterium]|nr:hypothetical protein [Candidatus Omnitrophota bacterium]